MSFSIIHSSDTPFPETPPLSLSEHLKVKGKTVLLDTGKVRGGSEPALN